MATVTQEYAASSNLTVTNLQSLASSQTWVSGWTSDTIDNTSDKHPTKLVSAKFTLAASNNQAGEIRVYVYTMLDDSNWPDLFSSGTEGTEGTATVHDTEQMSGLTLIWGTTVDNGASEPHNMPQVSIRAALGFMPAKFALFITGNCTTTTTAQFASSGNQVTVKGSYENIA